MRLRRLLIGTCCSIVCCVAPDVAHAQVPVRAVARSGESLDRVQSQTAFTITSALSLPPDMDVQPFIRPFTSALSTQLIGWPGLSPSTQAVLSQESLLERAFAPLQGPSIQLWGRLPDGGLVRWIGTRMEYDAPMWELP